MSLLQNIINFIKRSPKYPSTRNGMMNLSSLRLGDTIEIDQNPYRIQGRIIFTEGIDTWVEYFALYNDEPRWLLVRGNGRPRTSLLRKLKEKIGSPPPEIIEFEGVTYDLIDDGTASVTRIGKVEGGKPLSCTYWLYEDEEGDFMLAVKKWGEVIEVFQGCYLDISEIRIPNGTRSRRNKGGR